MITFAATYLHLTKALNEKMQQKQQIACLPHQPKVLAQWVINICVPTSPIHYSVPTFL